MTLIELENILDNNNGQLTEQEAIDFRNSFFNDPLYPEESWYLSLWQLSNKIDFINIEPHFWYVLKKCLLDWLLSDDDQSDIDGEWDVVTKQDGDKVERNLRLNEDILQALKDELLIEIGDRSFRVDSTKLQTAIDNVTP